MSQRVAPGVFTISFDVELAWGEFYRGPVGVERLLEARWVFPRLLRLLERHDIRATFAVVGHLLLDGCDGHPRMPRPSLSWRPQDWYDADPHTDEAHDPVWYAPSLIALIRNANPGHDVGSHGFSHIPFDEPGVSIEVARAEVAESSRLLRAAGHEGVSFVFPKNGVHHREVLAEHQFACYRGIERRWHQHSHPIVRKVGHLLDQALATCPPVGLTERQGLLLEVPSSMLFLSREGIRRYLPLRARVERARKGIARAIATGSVFHLWMHSEDLVPGADLMLEALESVLLHVRRRADQGEILVRTMADLAAECEPVYVPAYPNGGKRRPVPPQHAREGATAEPPQTGVQRRPAREDDTQRGSAHGALPRTAEAQGK
jgi:peptidoglycan/xylan/chitin deacetylase (PgdA/CDA1 family)